MENILLSDIYQIKKHWVKKLFAVGLIIFLLAASIFSIPAIKVDASILVYTNAATVENDVKALLQTGFDSMADVVEFKTDGVQVAEKFLVTDEGGNIINPIQTKPILQTLFDQQLMKMEATNFNAYTRLDIKNYQISISMEYEQNEWGTITDIQITVKYMLTWLDGSGNTSLDGREAVRNHARAFLNTSAYTSKSTDIDKLKAINRYICETFQYDYRLFVGAEKEQIIYSAYKMINDSGAIGGYKRGVCQAYAMYAYIMLKEAGYEAITIDGEANGGGHAWNMVKVGATWYHIDFTWDDPISTIDSDPVYKNRQNGAGSVSENYLLRADSEMSVNHYWTLTQDGYTYPVASTKWTGLIVIVDDPQPNPEPTATATSTHEILPSTSVELTPTPTSPTGSNSLSPSPSPSISASKAPSTSISAGKTITPKIDNKTSKKNGLISPIFIGVSILVVAGTTVLIILKKKNDQY